MTTITRTQVESWVSLGESETVEFKRTTGERRAGAQTLCGMLNSRGGRVLFGITEDQRVTGQSVSERTIEEVTN